MTVAASGNASVDGLLSGWIWTGGGIAYSDPDSRFDYGSYHSDFDGDGTSAQSEGFSRLSVLQLAAVQRMLDGDGAAPGLAVAGFTGLAISRAGGGSALGDIRLANTSDTPTAYAYTPGGGYGGDIWLGGAGGLPVAGNYDHLTLLHEIGHALGLKHAHEPGGFGPVPGRHNSLEFTVMTYRSYVGDGLDGFEFEEWGAPQSYMMLDIAALQHLYGADFSANAGDTTYRWTPGSGRTWIDGEVAIDPGANRIFATIWDGGGRDCYDLSAYSSDLRLDLRPGEHSRFARGQLADLRGGPNDGFARGNVFNALQYRGDRRSLIEDAEGGSGDDRIVGNTAGNRLAGADGADVLRGCGGSDTLVGGSGSDVFVFASVGESGPGGDRIAAGGGATAFQLAGRAGGDVIDLRGADADAARAGKQAFVFGESAGRGRLWVEEREGVSVVCGNQDGDGAAEFELRILDGSVDASDYSAGDFLL